jgi:hypothetical protein
MVSGSKLYLIVYSLMGISIEVKYPFRFRTQILILMNVLDSQVSLSEGVPA